MNDLLEWLAGGDARSDGAANQVAGAVLQDNRLMADLAEGLSQTDEIVRGRTMDAFEKIARSRPDLVLPYLADILKLARIDKSTMIGMHTAMLCGHLALYSETIPQTLPLLLDMLDESKVFTKAWAITSLCIIARREPVRHAQISERIHRLRDDPSAAIRTRVRYAMEILVDDRQPFPKGWIKSGQSGL
jgi:hypothetical protein